MKPKTQKSVNAALEGSAAPAVQEYPALAPNVWAYTFEQMQRAIQKAFVEGATVGTDGWAASESKRASDGA